MCLHISEYCKNIFIVFGIIIDYQIFCLIVYFILGAVKMSVGYLAGIAFAVFIVFSIIHYAGKNKRPFKRAFISMLCGLCTLLAVNLSGSITGVFLPISLLSILVSLIGGIPGVTLLLTLNLIFL